MAKAKKKYNNPPLLVEVIGLFLMILATAFIMFVADQQYKVDYYPSGLKNAQNVVLHNQSPMNKKDSLATQIKY